MANVTSSEVLSSFLNLPLFDSNGSPTIKFGVALYLLFLFLVIIVTNCLTAYTITVYLKFRYLTSTRIPIPEGWTDVDVAHYYMLRMSIHESCRVRSEREGIKIDCIVCFPPKDDNKV